MSKDFVANIHDPERAAEWQRILGITSVYVKSFFPTYANLPGHPNARIYELDLDLLTDDQRTKLTAFLAQKFGMDADQAKAMLPEYGVPILAKDVTITIHNPQKWL